MLTSQTDQAGTNAATIWVARDEEAGVWIANSPDVPGLIMETQSLDELEQVLPDLVRDLSEVGGQDEPAGLVMKIVLDEKR